YIGNVVRRRERNDSASDDDRAFEKFLQEQRESTTSKKLSAVLPVSKEMKGSKKNDSLDDFIHDSTDSSIEQTFLSVPTFYANVDRLLSTTTKNNDRRKITKRTTSPPVKLSHVYRKLEDAYASDETDDDNDEEKVSELKTSENTAERNNLCLDDIYASDASDRSSSPISSQSSKSYSSALLFENPITRANDTPKNTPLNNRRKNQTPQEKSTVKRQEVTLLKHNFLESLSNSVSNREKHPDALQYCSNFKKTRNDLAQKLFEIFDRDVFSSQFSKSEKVKVQWSSRLTATAGHCSTKNSVKDVLITLSEKVWDTPERCRDTLIHE
ncbi:unnamed protein product, partial [Didymodactylos carnosus]